MSEHGVTPTGFVRKRLDELLIELNTAVTGILGDSIDLTPSSPDGQINGTIAESQANLWEGLEAAYNAFDPNKASDVTLSNLVQLNGVTRFPATFSTTSLDLTGVDTTVIPAGSIVATAINGEQFTTDAEVTITGGVAVVAATAVNDGVVIAAAGSLTTIITPITGWATSTNLLDAVEGSAEESDEELRTRRENSFTLAAQNILDAMFDEISNVEGVNSVSVTENDTDAPVNGIPAHSFNSIVQGGDDADIAQAIFINKPAGIPSFGSVTVPVITLSGQSVDINFSRPTEIPIFIEMTITTFPDYPGNGDDLIKQAIVDYAEGRLITGKGFNVGDDVIQSELYTPINTVPGVQVDTLFIGIAPSPTLTDSIPIDFDEISTFDTANIVIA